VNRRWNDDRKDIICAHRDADFVWVLDSGTEALSEQETIVV